MDLQRLFYISQCRPTLEVDELWQIRMLSQSRNRALDVTGALLYTGCHFAQVLEGPAGSLDELMASIRADRRHTQVNQLYRCEATSRLFPMWSLRCVEALGQADLISHLAAKPPESLDRNERLVRLLFSTEAEAALQATT